MAEEKAPAHSWGGLKVVDETPEQNSWGAKPATKPSKAEILDAVDAAAKLYKLDPLILLAQIKQESNFDPHAWNEGGKAAGLMQLTPDIVKKYGIEDPFNFRTNVMGGARLMRELLDRKDIAGDYQKALFHYHAGFDSNQWGEKSEAYPDVVMRHYREAGGRLHDPKVPKVGTGTLAADAAVPFISAPELAIRAKNVLGLDLSPLKPEEENASWRDLLKTRWSKANVKDPEPEITALRAGIANAKEEDPWGTMGVQLGAAAPGMLALGVGTNALLRGASTAGVPGMDWLLGTAGRGDPITREGQNWLARAGSNALQGGIQGAVTSAAGAHMNPKVPLSDQTAWGAGVGAAMSAAGGGFMDVLKRAWYGKQVDPNVARLGLEALQGGNGVPALDLRVSPRNVNKLEIDTPQASRVGMNLIKEPGVVAGFTPGTNTPAWKGVRDRVGARIDAAEANARLWADGQTFNAIDQLATDFRLNIGRTPPPAVKEILNEIRLNVGQLLPAERFRKLTGEGSRVAQMIKSSNQDISTLGRGIKEELDKSLLRGTEEAYRQAVAGGNPQAAQQALQALKALREAKEDYKNFVLIDKARDPVKGTLEPGSLPRVMPDSDKIYGSGKMGRFSSYMDAFNPQNRIPDTSYTLPFSGLGALMSMGLGNSVTTGKAVLAATGASALGDATRRAVSATPGYARRLLQNSLRVDKGPVERGLAATSIPAAGLGGNMLFARTPNERQRAEQYLKAQLAQGL